MLWCVCAWLLWRTSVPSLHLSGFDEHRFFTARELRRAASFSRGEDVLWVLGKVTELAVLVVLVRVLPRSARGMELGRIATAIVLGMVLLTSVWAAALPFGLASLWWEHHWHLGPFDVVAWLLAQWAQVGAEVASVMAGVALVVGLAGRYRRWWLLAGPVIVAIAAVFAFADGWLVASGTHRLPPPLRADAARLERIEQVPGTPVAVQNVSSWTDQANAFTTGFGPSAHVVVWDTLLDGRFSRGEEDVVIAHELGHVRSRHILKAIGWSALIVLPTLWLLGVATRRRGGVRDPANLPYVFLVLTVLGLLTGPIQNAVSRRYEAEADWRALNATHDPGAARDLFRNFARTSLEDPDPGALDYLWLENHPTLMQRIAMTRAYVSSGRPSRGGPGSP